MQVNTQTIQRPTLWQSFLTEQLIWNSEYLEYIQTTVNAVTSTLHKTVKNTIDNIKKELNSEYRIAKDAEHKHVDCELAVGLTWSHDSIDKAFAFYKKMYPNCIIVKK